MGIRNASFTTYRRRTAKKSRYIYYVRFFNDASGKSLPGKSSHCTTNAEAIRWAMAQITAGTAFTRSHRDESGIFSVYLSAFWKDDGRHAETHEQPLNKAYLYNNRSIVSTHIILVPGERKKTNLHLSEITPQLLDGIITAGRKNGCSPRTANIVRQCMAVPFSEAYRLGLIKTNPGARREDLKRKNTRADCLYYGGMVCGIILRME